MKEEHVAGAYGIEGRYPFLDKFVVQEFLWLSADLKNQTYKSPLDNYLTLNKFPYKINQKTGFGCGFSGPTINSFSYIELTKEQKEKMKNRKVTENNNVKKVNLDKLLSNKTKSFENFYLIDKKDIKHVKGNCYMSKININFPGLKYFNKSRYTLEENNNSLKSPVANHSLISDKGKGLYSFWTSSILYFSSSDNSDPRINEREYSIIKLTNNFKNKQIETEKYFVSINIENCDYDTDIYFKIREIFNYLNNINLTPNLIVSNDFDKFMDLSSINYSKYDNKNLYLVKSKIQICGKEKIMETDLEKIKLNLKNFL